MAANEQTKNMPGTRARHSDMQSVAELEQQSTTQWTQSVRAAEYNTVDTERGRAAEYDTVDTERESSRVRHSDMRSVKAAECDTVTCGA